MAEVLLFHHAQGLTPGVSEFAETLRQSGHVVHVPDLYEGNVCGTLEEGIGYASQVGFGTIIERGAAAAESLPREIVYAGFSLGVLPAQMLAQARSGAKGALFFHSCVPASEFGHWPMELAAQVHGMDEDQLFTAEGDLDAARALARDNAGVELFLYPGKQHLFADSSLPSYDREAAGLLTERVVNFLARTS
ncbi:MAG: dienelactone hydrolase family protein [Trebonia sp.]